MKNIYKLKYGAYRVEKTINYQRKYFGVYPTVEVAKMVRDKANNVDWDLSYIQRIRNELRAEGVTL